MVMMGVSDSDGGISDMGWDTRCRWGSKHEMIGYWTGDDRVPGRGGVTTLMSNQSEILHSSIFDVSTNQLIS